MLTAKFLSLAKQKHLSAGRYLGAIVHAPTSRHSQLLLFTLGVALLAAGLSDGAVAQGLGTRYNDVRLVNALNAIWTYVEGAFGALVMVSAGIAAILSSAFGQYRAALGLLVVAVGAFILRSLVATFFNDTDQRA